MILELAMLTFRAGQEAALEAAFAGAQTLLARQPGYLGHELLCCLDAPGRYALHVRWTGVAEHELGFRGSDAYPEWPVRLHGFCESFLVERFGRVAPAPAGGRVLPYVTVDVFTDARFGGNPLAVFPDARGLSDAEMLAIAGETNHSETTFVLPPADPAHTAKVRILNRAAELPFAGHPNVGTTVVLAGLGRDAAGWLRFEEPAGLVTVRVERGADGAVTSAHVDAPRPLSLGRELAAADVAACVGLAEDDLLRAPPAVRVGRAPLLLRRGAPRGAGVRTARPGRVPGAGRATAARRRTAPHPPLRPPRPCERGPLYAHVLSAERHRRGPGHRQRQCGLARAPAARARRRARSVPHHAGHRDGPPEPSRGVRLARWRRCPRARGRRGGDGLRRGAALAATLAAIDSTPASRTSSGSPGGSVFDRGWRPTSPARRRNVIASSDGGGVAGGPPRRQQAEQRGESCGG